ncbi:Xaa-Pro peptidase family protein [Bosea sp. (in: a-proteobacteria)]|uniref:M24 family metallopeptidase n=1 Tax=Bosea sp. (in: a-proteobacteria) TaxID=1871050 RepID=UPI00262EC85A|nr:Xaa-Pro peptidase family protein [Bosea sp. (in: a-proteobacteria)]MCO5092583.1 Xaa-Pro peptidase family protein [Bosea sp. (in: a-proteobacteria)]
MKKPASSRNGWDEAMATSPFQVPDFPREEFEQRLARLQGQLKDRNLAGAIIDDQEILSYICNYERTVSYYRACVVPAEGAPVMVLRALDLDPFRAASWMSEAVGYRDDDDPVARVAEVAGKLGIASRPIGIDFGSHALTVATFNRLQRALPSAQLVDLGGLLWENRLIKSRHEIAYITAAAAIADTIVSEIAEYTRAGDTTRGISGYAAGRYIALGGSTHHIGPITAGKGWGFLHAAMSTTPLSDGDILHLELTPRMRGYGARLMRSVVIGPIAAPLQDKADKLVALQDRQFEAMKPGAIARDVDAILRQGVLDAGLRESYANITGYTLGFYGTAAIRSSDFTRTFRPNADWRLEAGMVFHMYTSAQGLAFSETILVTDDGARRLTQAPRKAFSTADR